MKRIGLTYLLIIGSYIGWSQNYQQNPTLFKLNSVDGEIKSEGFYREQDRSLTIEGTENTKSSLFTGGLLLNTNSTIYHPNFLLLDVDMEYNPGKYNQNSLLVIPDRSEARTLSKFSIGSTFFNDKIITLKAFANFHNSYNNRENLSNIKSNRKTWGGLVLYKNKTLPFMISYQQGKWDQEEIATGRIYKYQQKNIQSRITKSFRKNDRHELSYTHDEYVREDLEFFRTDSKTDNLMLNNRLYFDPSQKYSFNSIITGYNQTGTLNYSRFQANESTRMKLPYHLKLGLRYNFNYHDQKTQQYTQNIINSNLDHQLFESLRTNVFFTYSNTNHSVYNKTDNRAGINIKYTKKIPVGTLMLGYNIYRQYENMKSEPVSIQVINESRILSDDQIVLLKREHVIPETVVVKDTTSTIIYQLYYDYILVGRNTFMEIQRIPGGQIPNDGIVYVDYTAIQPGTYKYNASNTTFSASLLMFQRIVEVYYRHSKQDYDNIEKSDLLTLNFYKQNLYGVKLDLGWVKGGVEYDDYESSITPYRLLRYFVRFQKKYKDKFILSLNGNIRDYRMINYSEKQKFSDVSGRVAYHFKPRQKINLELGYRKQEGRELDLDLFTGKCEFTTSIRQLFLTLGLEVYRRDYVSEKINFNGGYVRVLRKF